MSELKNYTMFCKQSNGKGTMWIQSVAACSTKEASAIALDECADAWDFDTDDIRVVGIAEGDINILEWEDFDD